VGVLVSAPMRPHPVDHMTEFHKNFFHVLGGRVEPVLGVLAGEKANRAMQEPSPY
jgi:hypothetical protein